MQRQSVPLVLIAGLLGWWLTPVDAWAANPADRLLGLVSDDVAFCVLANNARANWDILSNAPYARRLAASPLGAKWLSSPELARLAAYRQKLESDLQIGWKTLRDDILGDAVLFAYRLGPPGKPELEQGLLLLQARDPQRLTALIERINALQRLGGELKEIEVREHAGAKYVRRHEARGERFYFQRDGLFALTASEDWLRQVIGRAANADDAADAGMRPRFRQLAPADAGLAWWINPRAFEAELARKRANARGRDALVLQALAGYWRALAGIVLSATVRQDVLELRLCAAVENDALPPAARRFRRETAKPSRLWSYFPDDALIAIADRFEPGALGDVVGDFLPETARREVRTALQHVVGPAFGRDVAADILPAVGPDWGLVVTAPPAGAAAWLPQVTLAVRVAPDAKGQDAGRTLLQALQTFARLWVLMHNSQHRDVLALQSESQGQIEVHFLVHDTLFPPGWRPAFALKDGFLLVTGTPEGVRRFSPLRAAPENGDDLPLIRLSLGRLKVYCKEHRQQLVHYLADKKQVSVAEINQRLDALLTLLDGFDQILLLHQPKADRISWTLRLQAAGK